MHEYDKASRYMIKQDPPGFFGWLWWHADTPLQFHSWLDARRLALPDESDLTCDIVAGFQLADQAELSHALIVEFMAESRSETLTRMLAYVVLQRSWRDESAADTLTQIAVGRTTRWLLPWVPLMTGGDDLAIMERWKQVALTEPDTRVRARLGAFALVFARRAQRDDLWKQALGDWDMSNLQEVDYWHHEGRTEGEILKGRQWLLTLLESRFGSLPEELIQRIQAVEDIQRLDRAFQQALHLQSLADLQL
jgi:hypothetical protein